MVKKYLYQFRNFWSFSKNSTSQTRFNVYTLILEKNFQIYEKEKNIYYTKLYDLISNIK